MRIITLLTMTASLAAPLAAQDHKVVYTSNDTTLNFSRQGDDESCVVKVGGRELSERDAKAVCDRLVSRNIVNGRLLSVAVGDARLRSRLLETTGRQLEEVQLGNLARMQELRATTDQRYTEAARAGATRTREALRATEGVLELQSKALSAQGRAMSLQSRELAEAERNFVRAMPSLADRAIIGVNIDPRARDTDRWGSYVAGVTPNGPAEKAGLRIGDIITKVDGKSLTSGDPIAVNADESLPSVRLIAIVSKLEPGKAVDLEYRRDNSNQKTRITPVADRWLATIAPSPRGVFTMAPSRVGGGSSGWTMLADTVEMSAPSIIAQLDRSGARAPSIASSFAFFGPLARIELAPLNTKLGAYFGASEGVLVINVPESDNFGLQPGDVIVAVDGRNVDSPSAFHRIIRSYQSEDTFTLRVMRQKQSQVLTTTMP